MSDLIERLTKYCSGQVELGREAATELERLTAENARLRRAPALVELGALSPVSARDIHDENSAEIALLTAENAALRATLIHLAEAYRNPHSPQHRAAALNEAVTIVDSARAKESGDG